MIFSLNGCVEQWMDRDALTQITKGKSMIRIKYGSSRFNVERYFIAALKANGFFY